MERRGLNMKTFCYVTAIICLAFFSASTMHAATPSQQYIESHAQFEINFLESVLDLKIFSKLSDSQIKHIEENFSSHVKKVYGTMDEAQNLLAYALEDYSIKFLDLVKLIERDVENLTEAKSHRQG